MPRLYDTDAWQRLRLVVLSGNPYCVHCRDRRGVLTPATQVDHIRPVREYAEGALDPANLQSLCHSCHSSKTATEERGGPMRGCDVEGKPIARGDKRRQRGGW